MKSKEVIAKAIVKDILKDFSDRRGLRQEWDMIDNDIQKEILTAWEKIILKRIGQNA